MYMVVEVILFQEWESWSNGNISLGMCSCYAILIGAKSTKLWRNKGALRRAIIYTYVLGRLVVNFLVSLTMNPWPQILAPKSIGGASYIQGISLSVLMILHPQRPQNALSKTSI